MGTKFATHVDAKNTPQDQPLEGQVPNSAGGHSFVVDKWGSLSRFLILGTEGGTYYITEKKLTIENTTQIKACIDEDGQRVVDMVVDVSDNNKAAKNDYALFVLALAASAKDVATRQAALVALPKVARIPTHLFNFATFIKGQRGWGKALKRAVADWYTDQTVDGLAYQTTKYKQRNGWSNRDMLRLSHPKTKDKPKDAVLNYITTGTVDGRRSYPDIIIQSENIKTLIDKPKEAAALISKYNLPREVVPTELLGSIDVWTALLERMPLTALIRNLGKMSSIGLLKPMTAASKKVAVRLTNKEALSKARIHPYALYMAFRTYEQGHGDKGSLSWTVVPSIVDALETAFYLSFDYVKPSNKNIYIGLDVSSSMAGGSAGGAGVTPHEAAAVLAMTTVRTEPNTYVAGFTDIMKPINLTPKDNLTSAYRKTQDHAFGSTDCSLPMRDALAKGINNIDAFVVITDNETGSGYGARAKHPVLALQEYRNKTGRPAKLIVVAMTANGFTIADPNDAGMLDVVGMSTATPRLISSFIAE